jgi:drug/metabolite transporter (DMT)-like permease
MRRLALLAWIWGWSFFFIKVAVAGLTPTTVACTRILLGAAVMLVLLHRRGLSLPRDRTTWRHFAVMGVVASAVPFTLLSWGEQRITSALASVLNASTPLFAALFAAVFLAERLRPPRLVGLALGFAGVGVAAGIGGGDLAHSSVAGGLAAVAAAACYGITFVYAQRHLVGVDPVIATAGQLISGGLFLLPFALATSVADGVHLSPTRTIAIVLLGVFGTGFAYVLNYRNIVDLGPTKASVVTYIVPLVAVAVGVAVLDEHFSVRILAGGLLIVAGLALLQGRLFRRNRAVPTIVAALCLAVLLPACTSSSRTCDNAVRERLDSRSDQHLLGGAPDPTYRTNPPTSGPHRVGAWPTGALHEPIQLSKQVAMLEGGAVLLQYRGLRTDEQRRLEALASDTVTVAPGRDLPARIVATAWTWKQTCRAVDVTRLRGFVRAHGGKGA